MNNLGIRQKNPDFGFLCLITVIYRRFPFIHPYYPIPIPNPPQT
jgi:hypothetical protein